MKIKYSCLTDTGPVRKINEDSLYLNGEIINMLDSYISPEITEMNITGDVTCFSVADGMGGHEAGEIASRMTLEKFSALIKKHGNTLIDESDLLKKGIEGIHAEINEYGYTTNKTGMGTTLVGAIFNNEKFIVFNVGDSRLYILRDGYLVQKTRDHSLFEQLGGNTPKNYITSSIGGGVENITIDIFDLAGKVRKNDLIIICSDGLTDFNLDEIYDEFEALINGTKDDLKVLNRSLYKNALDHGSADNISVISILVLE